MTPDALRDLPRPVLLLDPASAEVTFANHAAQEWFGRSERTLRKTPLETLLDGVDDAAGRVARVHASTSAMEMRDLSVAGRAVALTLFPSGGAVGLLIVPDRATSSRQVQGRTVHSLGQMIGHEIKNPLAGIKGAAQLLRADAADAETRSLLDLISSETDRIRRLADRLQSFGDSENDERSRVNVHTLLRNARKVVAPTKGGAGIGELFFTEDYDPSLPHVRGDSDTLMQVVVNLVKNAAEAIDYVGEITLRTRSRAGVKRGDRHLPVELQVIDTGPGLPAHMRDRVFEPFVTSKPSGQGLGLSLVAKVVESHGGLVEVDSRPGRTVFSVLLPAANDEADHAA